MREIEIFGKVVIDLLRYVQSQNNKGLQTKDVFSFNEGKYTTFDAKSPDGFLSINGDVYFEVKRNKTESDRLISLWNNNKKNKSDTLVIILLNRYENKSKKNQTKNNISENIIIWDFEDIYELAKKYSFAPFFSYYNESDLNKYISKIDNENDISILEKDSSIQLTSVLKNIIEKSNNKVVFVFGAGVSIPYNLSDWDKLLEELFLKKDFNIIESKIFSKTGNSPLIKAQLLYDLYEVKNDNQKIKLVKEIQEHFYFNFREDNRKTILKSFANYIKNKVNIEVITYNYDDILEYELGDIESYQVLSSDEKISNKKIKIYHPHGYLPRNQVVDLKMANSIILSENNYNNLYNNPYAWANIIQINKFRENICVFVGTSLKDPSIRRLLELSVNTSLNNHYAFFKKDELNSKEQRDVEKHFSRLGVNIIWISNYDDIITFIETLT